MATSKRVRPEKGFYRSVERDVPIKGEKLRPKLQEKVDTEKMYPIEVCTGIVFWIPSNCYRASALLNS